MCVYLKIMYKCIIHTVRSGRKADSNVISEFHSISTWTLAFTFDLGESGASYVLENKLSPLQLQWYIYIHTYTEHCHITTHKSYIVYGKIYVFYVYLEDKYVHNTSHVL
jgi:hypothetical protein